MARRSFVSLSPPAALWIDSVKGVVGWLISESSAPPDSSHASGALGMTLSKIREVQHSSGVRRVAGDHWSLDADTAHACRDIVLSKLGNPPCRVGTVRDAACP